MSVLCEYVIAAYFAYCRIFCIFQQSAHITYFPHKLAFSSAISVSITRALTLLVGRQEGHPACNFR